MYLSEQVFRFWRTIEYQMNIDISNHIKNNLFLCGYANFCSIQQIGNEDIEYIENFVKLEIMDLVEMKFRKAGQEVIDDNTKRNFFGVYINDIQNFRFSPAERKMISSIAAYASTHNLVDDRTEYISKDWLKMNTWFFDEVEDEKNRQINAPKYSMNLLCKLLSTARINSDRTKHGFRYTPEMIRFYVYIRSIAGPLAYNTLQINLPGILPSISTVNKYIHRPDFDVVEGLLRCEELLAYLRKRNLPLWVSLSEDATRIENRLQYDSSTNQIIGFVQPIDENGMPLSFTYKARTAMEMLHYFINRTPISSYVNTVMAKPFGCKQSFCLLVFGTDNQYSAGDVANRWEFISKELARAGIGVLSIASDSDPKFNCAMRNNSKLGCPSEMINPFFNCNSNIGGPYYFQDAPHIVTKLRNRLLKTISDIKVLQFGPKHIISIKHLQHLVDSVRRDKHMLTQTIVTPNDRQDYDSAIRICDTQVIDALKRYVPQSEGTVIFLQIMSNIIDSYMDDEISPLARIEKIWFSLFIVRIWQYFIKKHPRSTIKNNFLTSNCFSCLEQNAHSVILIILFLKEKKLEHLFIPSNFNSQPCEQFYRQIRSLSTTYSTVVSCSLKEILNRISKIQLLDEISNDSTISVDLSSIFKGSNAPKETITVLENTIKYFKRGNEHLNTKTFELPSKEEIIAVIEKSRDNAIKLGIQFELIKNNDKAKYDSCMCNIPYHVIQQSKIPSKDQTKSADINNPEIIARLGLNRNLRLKNFADRFTIEQIDEISPYCEIPMCRKKFICRKNQWCWFLAKESSKLSSDRLLRVKSSASSKKIKNVKQKCKRKIVGIYSL